MKYHLFSGDIYSLSVFKPLFLLIAFIMLTLLMKGQSGPGGVGHRDTEDMLVLWLEAGEGITKDVGDNVTQWDDLSGYSNNATSTGDDRPLYVSSAINGLPGISFSNDQMTIPGDESLQPDYITIFAVLVRDYTTGWGDIISRPYYNYNKWSSPYTSYTLNSCNSHGTKRSEVRPFSQVAVGGSQVANWNPPHDEVPNGTPYLHAMEYTGSGMGSYLNNASIPGYSAWIAHSGVLDYDGSIADVSIGTRSSYLVSNPPNDHFLKGKISELIIYDIAINEAAHIIVANALSAKYDIEIGWDVYAEETGFTTDVLGIGRDDDEQHLSAEAGSLKIETTSFTTNTSYVFAGHNNLSLDRTTTNIPVSYNSRMNRIWYVASTGTKPATITITFILENKPGSDQNNYGLLYSTNSDMSSPLEITKAGSVDQNENEVSFTVTSAELDNGFYTLGSLKNHWTGASGNDWNSSDNWEKGAISGADDDVYIVNTATSPQINSPVSSPALCNDLFVESGATLTVNAASAITIGDEFTNNGTVIVESDDGGTGSMIVEGTANGEVDFERYLDETDKADAWHYVSSPVSGQALNNTWMSANSIAQAGTQYQFYRWDEDTDYWIYFDYTGTEPENFADDEFVAARGYALTRNGAGDVSFTGDVRTQDMNYSVSFTESKGKGWNLCGNPFSASIGITDDALTTAKFLNDNAALLDDNWEAIFVWDEQSDYTYGRNDYKIISNSAIVGYTQIEQDYVQPGQAFMVKVISNGNLQFTEDMQAHASGSFFKEKQAWPSVELLVEGNGLSNTTAIGFHKDMTEGLDPSYDVGKLKGNPDIALYTRLVEDNGVDFALQALPLFEEEYSVPVGIDLSQTGEYTFEVIGMKLIPDEVNVYFEDKQTATIVNLKNTSKYSCMLNQAGNITERFMLHFTLTPFNTDEINANAKKIMVWSTNNTINLYNPDQLIGTIKIFNLYGQQIMQARLNGNEQQQIAIEVPAAYYLVNVISKKSVFSKKVFVH